MISFKIFLTEARSAPLYHGTTYSLARSILYDNVMRASHSDDGYTTRNKTISFTRSYKFAKDWKSWTQSKEDSPIVLEFDQLKLTHNYKLKPYNFFGAAGFQKVARNIGGVSPFLEKDELEEYTDRDINDVKKYITKIYISGNTTEFNKRVGILSYLWGKELPLPEFKRMT